MISTHINGQFAGNYTSIDKVPIGKEVTPIEKPDEFIKGFWNGSEWIETITQEELDELNKPIIPEIVSRRQFKIALSVLGYNEENILNGINQLPEPNRTIARISYTESGTFERSAQDLIFVAKTFLSMNDEQIDQVFLTAISF